MKVKLARRWGSNREGATVDVDDVQGAWLVQHNYGESSGDVVAPEQQAAAPGAHGADPLAGGDATRRRPRVPRSQGSTASPASGSLPTYRAGFDAEASTRQGPAGRPARAAKAARDGEKPAKARSESES